MEAIVLAGGFGTRLKSVVSDLPKPMAPINDIPFLEYLMTYLSRNGISRVVLSVGYKNEIIKEYFGDKFENIDIIYCVEDTPLGTGGAIKKALEFCRNDYVLVFNGDTFFDIDIKKFFKKSHEGKIDILLALKEMYKFDRYGSVQLQDNRIIGFNEKKFMDKGNINGGIYLVRKDLLINITEDKFSFENIVLEKGLDTLLIEGILFDGYFIDIGIPEDYEKAQQELANIVMTE